MAAQFYQIVSMLFLLACSAFFSGAETAFFNLSRRQVQSFRDSKHKVQNLVASLLNKPGHLLDSFLFGNMTVNVLFYAVSSILIMRIREQGNLVLAAIMALTSFAALVLLGEILPKSIAYANSKAISLAAALPAFLCFKIFTPLEYLFKFVILEPTLRLLLGPARNPKPITVSEFKILIDTTRKQGLISPDENKLLTEVIELGLLKVRHVMRPRVDMPACSVTDSPETARKKMQKNQITKLPVYVETIDNIVGIIHLRQLLLKSGTPLDKIVQHVHFVPEQKTVESLLEFFRRSRTDMAMVVDEYGGIAGSVQLEDIAEELFGQIEQTSPIDPIKQTGPFEYRLAGNLATHDWAEVFGIDLTESSTATVGGLVTALLGKIPKNGDVAYLKNFKFTIEKMQKNRIETLILTLQPFQTDDK
ncbi:MAG: HlyC/CorC family transporter [Sedimentisphaerales bacterium]|nr:HlyC/CorC family transporter [Sedimentisphaerales bacterium]